MTRRWFLTLSSALLSAALFPAWNLTPFAWVAVAPLLVALHGVSPRWGAWFGMLWGVAMIWGVGHWVPAAVAYYYEQPGWFGVLFALAASVVFCGTYYAGFGACAAWISQRTQGAGRVILWSTLWVAWEMARASLLTGDPWLLLGYALLDSRSLLQSADWGGVYALSFVLLLANAGLAETILRVAQGQAPPEARVAIVAGSFAPVVIVAGLYFAYGQIRLATALPPGRAFDISVVQANNDLGAQWKEELYGQGLDRYLALSQEALRAQRPRLLVWPESAVTFYLSREPQLRQRIERTIRDSGAELILGGPHLEDSDPAQPHYYNSAFHLDRSGTLRGRYDKAHLLPFGEYFPLKAIELLRRQFERTRYFTPGDGTTLLDTEVGRIATVICFEGLFPDLVRRQMAGGAELLLNLSNDAWLLSSAGAEQHMRMVALRAVENRSWLVRSTTTGVSVIVDPFGSVRARADSGVSSVLSQRVTAVAVPTFYKRYGDVFAYACLLHGAGVMAWLRWRRREGDRVRTGAGHVA